MGRRPLINAASEGNLRGLLGSNDFSADCAHDNQTETKEQERARGKIGREHGASIKYRRLRSRGAIGTNTRGIRGRGSGYIRSPTTNRRNHGKHH